MRAAVLGESQFRHDMLKPAKIYPSLAAAIEARVSVCAKYPGNQYISQEAAAWIVGRGSRLATDDDKHRVQPDTDDNYVAQDLVPDLEQPDVLANKTNGSRTSTGPQENEIGPVRFRYDPRLMLPSHTYLTDEQVEGFVNAISCPTLLVSAKDGWPARDQAVIERRMAILSDKGLLKHKQVEGSHHCHADPQHAPAVLANVMDFFKVSLPERKESERTEYRPHL